MAARSRTHRARYGAVLVIGLVLLSAGIGTIMLPTAAAQKQTQSQRHRLVIIHGSGSASWVITASGSVHLDESTTENTDSIGGTTASGSVGGLPWDENATDPKDVIYYTGKLLHFDLGGTGTARVTLDGKRVTPPALKNTPTPTQTTPTPTPTYTTTTPTTLPTESTTTATGTSIGATHTSSPSGDGGSGSSFTFSFVIALAAGIMIVVLWHIE